MSEPWGERRHGVARPYVRPCSRQTDPEPEIGKKKALSGALPQTGLVGYLEKRHPVYIHVVEGATGHKLMSTKEDGDPRSQQSYRVR